LIFFVLNFYLEAFLKSRHQKKDKINNLLLFVPQAVDMQSRLYSLLAAYFNPFTISTILFLAEQ
jgi:hypothetical protein